MSFTDAIKLWIARAVAEIGLFFAAIVLLVVVGVVLEWRKSHKGGAR